MWQWNELWCSYSVWNLCSATVCSHRPYVQHKCWWNCPILQMSIASQDKWYFFICISDFDTFGDRFELTAKVSLIIKSGRFSFKPSEWMFVLEKFELRPFISINYTCCYGKFVLLAAINYRKSGLSHYPTGKRTQRLFTILCRID